MYTLTVTSQKGGVGKTTTAHAIGAGLSLKGYRVLFIDLDDQGNLSLVMRADKKKPTALDVLRDPKTVAEAIQHTEQGDIIASSRDLAGADNIITATGKEYRLREALEICSGNYDYCIIDTPPHLGILIVNALTASRGAIIPAKADLFSLQGLYQLQDTINAVKKYCNPELEILGIVLTMYKQRTIINRELADVVAQTAKDFNTKAFNTKIRDCTALQEASYSRIDIYRYAPRSNATADYTALIAEIFGEEIYNNG